MLSQNNVYWMGYMLASLIVAGVLASQTTPLRLDLICQGQADIGTSETTDIGEPGGPINFVTTNGRNRVPERVSISFNENGGRIRLPDSMLPSIRGRSEDGWRPLANVSIGEDLITGRMSFNFIDKPSVRLDRVTGTVEIRGIASSFTGECQPYDSQARRF